MPAQVSVVTPRVRLSWRGPFAADGAFEARSLRDGPVEVSADAPGAAVPGLVEEAAYTLWVESRTGEAVEVRHRDPVVTAALRSEQGARVVTGTVAFGSHVGRTRVLVFVGGRPELEVEADVRPTKVSPEAVEAMRDAVDAAWAGVPFAALRPTAEPHAPGPRASAPAWLALLRASADALDRALLEIARRPASEIERRPAPVPAHRARRPDAAVRASVRRAGGVPDVLDARRVDLGLDTPSHRWLAARLTRVQARLRDLASAEARRPETARRVVVLDELAALGRRAGRHLYRDPLAAASRRAPASPPLALRRRPAYAAAYDALRALDGGLARAEGDVRPSLLDLAALYEAWCAFVLVREAAAVLGVEPPPSPFGLRRSGVDVRLRRGPGASVRLEADGRRVEIVYSPHFADPRALLAQRPDLLLTVDGQRRIVLDAKYRRDGHVSARTGVAGPPSDAVGALHRYRDAILGPGGTSGWVDEAVALFPPADLGGYEAGRLWTGLETIGVGAIPLAPGQTAWLRRWLERTLARGASTGVRA